MTEKLETATSAADILEADDTERTPVDVPEWKRRVFLRVLPAAEAIALEEKIRALPEAQRYEAIYHNVAACLVDADGKRLFVGDDAVEKLKTRNPKVLMRLQNIAMRMNNVSALVESAKNASGEEAAAPASSRTA